MKTMKYLALATIMMVAGAVTVNAQERVVTLGQLKNAQQNKDTGTTTRQTVTSSGTSSYSSSSAEGWSSVYAQYNISSMRSHSEYDGHKYNDSEGFSAVTLGWNMALGLFGDLPLYVQPGVALTYGWYKPDSDSHGDNHKLNMLSAKVPINLLYSIQLGDSPVSIDPYLGIYGRCFIFAQSKYAGETVSMFSKDDVGKNSTWNRFQIGAQAGLNVRFNQFFVGAEYAMDATEVWKHEKNTLKFNALSINLGMCF